MEFEMKKMLMVVLAVAAGMAGANDFQANPVPALGQNARNQTAFDAAKKGPRVLFVGNSITLHGPRPQIGWTNIQRSHGNPQLNWCIPAFRNRHYTYKRVFCTEMIKTVWRVFFRLFISLPDA